MGGWSLPGSVNRPPNQKLILPGLALLVALALFPAGRVAAVESAAQPATISVDEIRPGMKGEARTVFAGYAAESFDLEVLGVLKNFFGPQQDIILVRLLGARVQFTGVVAGMSGSPVYIEGRLAGALSLRFGLFTKEPIAGVTPIANMLRIEEGIRVAAAEAELPPRYPLPEAAVESLGLPAGSPVYLLPIETPLTLTGFYPQAIARFAEEFSRYGWVTVPGGSAAAGPSPPSALEPGGAVSAALITGDFGVFATCTITLLEADRLYACGHPIFALGAVEMPMARAEIVTTVASQLGSFKIANLGELIGSFTQDRRTAIVGRLGKPPAMIPVELTLANTGKKTVAGAANERTFRFELFQHPRLTAQLLALTVFNGLVGSTEYGEETSYRISGRIELQGHPALQLDDMFSPGDVLIPDAFLIANQVTQAFQRLYSNPFEPPRVERIRLRLEMIPERRSATLENAWSDKTEVEPGETLTLKVVLQPYRGPRRLLTVPVQVPLHAAKGDLRILVSDATLLDRLTRSGVFDPRFAFLFGPRPTSLDQLVALLNRERRNDHIYVSLFQRNPTLLVQDKILPSVPLSQMNVLSNQTAPGQPGSTAVFYESLLSEVSEPLELVVSGGHWLQVRVR